MARSISIIPYRCDYLEAQRRAEAILTRRGYRVVTLKTGEIVWKKGVGLWTAMHFIKIEYGYNGMQLSGWVQAGLGSAGLSEMALDGFVACLPKKQVKKVIEEIQRAF